MNVRSLCVLVAMAAACKTTSSPPAAQSRAAPAQHEAAPLVDAIVAKHGAAARARAEQGVRQVLAFWRAEDGDPKEFVADAFVSDPAALTQLLGRFSLALEQVDGHMLEIGRALRSWSELELGPQMPVDQLFAALDVSAHLPEDLFASKLAFVALLNFPLPDFDTFVREAPSYSRRQWAEVRLTRRFALRPSGAANAARAKASADAEAYIAVYNLWMHHVLAPDGTRVFPKGTRLLTHWNLRDQIKADYAEKDQKLALARQRLIRDVMQAIVAQTIPLSVIDDPRVDWNPATNAVTASPPEEIETEQMKAQGTRPGKPQVSNAREPDRRYAVLLEDFRAARQTDADSPMARTEIDRRFQLDDELPEQRVRALLLQVISSPLVPRLGKIISQRLGRPLEAHDIWYDGFEEKQPEGELSKRTRARYPTAEAYKKDIPRLLEGLGFSPDRARYLDGHIVVDPARGSGHALQSARRSEGYPWWGPGDSPHLRTRINPDGMDYKGYNIAVHEMGHNVEQVFSLYDVDDTLMSGVPGTAFTEALAFTFQHKDLELLGVTSPSSQQAAARARALKTLWDTWEIAGVGLTDLDVWHWMYDHPDATPAQLREATLQIARGHWDKYYAPVLGSPGSPQLAIYSHIINSPLYVFRYSLGHLIAFQLEEALAANASRGTYAFGEAFEHAARLGHVLPDLWMQNATGHPVVAEPLLHAAEAAISAEEQQGR